MSPKTVKKIQLTLEWAIVVFMFFGGITLFFADPISSGGPLTSLLGSRGAGFVYGSWFILLSIVLGYAKARKRLGLKKRALFSVYLTTIFVFILELMLIGWSWFLIDSVIIFLIAGYGWLELKFRTEYMDKEQFKREMLEEN